MKYALIFFILIQYNLLAYESILLARSYNRDGYHLPPLSYLNGTSPVINDEKEVTFRVMAQGSKGLSALWIKSREDENGKILFVSPEDKMVSDPSMNKAGMIAFTLFDDARSEGIYVLDPHKLTHTKYLNADNYDLDFYTYPFIDDANMIYFRGTSKNNERAFYRYDGSLKMILKEGKENSHLTSSYLFRPSFNNHGDGLFKLRLGKLGEWGEENPDIIAFYSGEKYLEDNMQIIAVDKDKDQSSSFRSFFNQVALSDNHSAVYMALLEDNRVGLFLYDVNEKKTINIALENEGDVLNIENFSPRINNRSHVVFRGIDRDGLRAIFFYDGKTLKKIIREGDPVPSDKGPAFLLSNPHFPAFIGELGFNNLDDLVFGAMMSSSLDQKELGTGIFQFNHLDK